MFQANFSTKFAVWDYLFGTAYDPGHSPGDKPENWGLYYDYPKDYFLQRAFSVKRFDEKSLLKYKWFSWYYNLRGKCIDLIKKYWLSCTRFGANDTKKSPSFIERGFE